MSSYESLSETQQFACRVIADHARATAFAIADGILPGNEGRNYVLRKIMRRAIYHGREHLGLKDLFFYKVCDFVIGQMHDAYPELEAQREFIGKMVRLEEERFGNTLTIGLERVKKQVDEVLPLTFAGTFAQIDLTSWAGEFADLYDTFGVPTDLIYVIVAGRVTEINNSRPEGSKLTEIDPDQFSAGVDLAVKKLQAQQNIGQTERKSQISPMYAEVLDKVGHGKFHGYDMTRLEDAEVVAIIENDKQVDTLSERSEGLIVLKDTPYYAEAGGQVGDTGILTGVLPLPRTTPSAQSGGHPSLDKEGSSAAISSNQEEELSGAGRVTKVRVLDTFSPVAGLILHKSKVESGTIKVGDKVTAVVDGEKRDATRRNHTATHLVHAALREVLGTHVKQAGSVVAPNYLRFDFTHYQPMTEEQIGEIEDLVNRYILENQPVNTNIQSIEEAMSGGAMALFGEKYGADVRVLSVGDGVFSKELCGGTHVKATGDIGAFKIISDEAIASGVRRIRAITGFDAFERFREDERLIDRSLSALKTQRDNLPNAIERLQEEVKRTRKEIDELKLKIATGAIGNAASSGDEARDVSGVKVHGKIVEGLDGNGARQLSDTLLARLKSGVVVLGRESDGKVSIIVRVSDDLTGRVKAGNVIKEIVPIVGGKGGGRPDMAEGGGAEPDKLADAIEASYGVIEKMLG